jgi:hypothetical protein
MSEALDINGEQFVPSNVAAKQVGYTGDYVARLAREKKIDGTKVGKGWFVSLTSLQQFLERAKEEKQARVESLRKERKLEQLAHSRVNEVPQTSTQSIRLPKRAPTHGRSVALAETIAVLFLGLCFGVSGYFVSTAGFVRPGISGSLLFNNLALFVYRGFSPLADGLSSEGTAATASIASGEEETVDHHSASAVSSKESRQDATTSTTTLVRDSFSDDVDVIINKDNPNVAVVFPKFSNSTSTGHRFLVVPLPNAKEEMLRPENFADALRPTFNQPQK